MAVQFRSALGFLLVLVLALSGCSTAPDRSEVNRGAGGATSQAQKPGNTVLVSLVDFAIEMPASISPGRKVFEVTNKGTVNHSFGIRGNGIDAKLDSPLIPGATRTLEADLQPGNYQVYCPVDQHRDRGMAGTLVVR